MPKYQKAKPFDLITTIKDLQTQLKQITIRNGTLVSIPTLQSQVATLQSQVATLQSQVATSWTSLSLQNSWTGSGGGDVNGVAYRRVWVGAYEVEVEGDIINTTVTGNSICATLPAGSRPATPQNKLCFWNNPASSNSASPPWVFVNTDGTIQITGIEVVDKGIFFSFRVPLETL